MNYSGKNSINTKKLFSKQEKLAIISLAILFFVTYTLAGFGFFNNFPYFDNLTHFLGGFFLALFFVDYFKKALVVERRLIGDVAIIVGASLTVGVFWEVFEFAIVSTREYTNITLIGMGNLADTIKDLLVDMLGAAAMFFVIRYRHKKSVMFR